MQHRAQDVSTRPVMSGGDDNLPSRRGKVQMTAHGVWSKSVNTLGVPISRHLMWLPPGVR
jgi:hypothetical protein